MTGYVAQALDELRHAIWMLMVPFVVGILSFVGGCQWMIQDLQMMNQLEEINGSSTGVIHLVDSSQCDHPKPAGSGHVCAQSTEWWTPIDTTECVGGQCYAPQWLVRYEALLGQWERSYLPLLIPGLLPLVFLFVVIRKIKRVREALTASLRNNVPANPTSHNAPV